MPTFTRALRSKFRRSEPGRAAAGFTLVEVMVVMVIVALMAGLLVVTVSDTPQRRLQREAGDLAALLNFASDEAVLRGVELGLIIDDHGYRFVYFDPEKKKWLGLPDKALKGHAFKEPYEVTFALDGEQLDAKTQERIKKLSERSEDEDQRPMLLLLSSGEFLPFTLTLRFADNTPVTLSGDGVNPILVQQG